jgi:lysozyme
MTKRADPAPKNRFLMIGIVGWTAFWAAVIAATTLSKKRAVSRTGRTGPWSAEGIDVSDAQGTIDWNAVAGSGRLFAFIKATEGLAGAYRAQTTFAANWKNSAAAGVLRGSYHYFHPTLDAVAQAQFHYQTVQAASVAAGVNAGDLGPALDCEEMNGVTPSAYGKGVLSWCQETARLFGRRPIVYTDLSFWAPMDAETSIAIGEIADLWLAEWSVKKPGTVTGWSAPTFWQYAGDPQNSHVPGIGPAVDLDRFQGTYDDLLALREEPVA